MHHDPVTGQQLKACANLLHREKGWVPEAFCIFISELCQSQCEGIYFSCPLFTKGREGRPVELHLDGCHIDQVRPQRTAPIVQGHQEKARQM